MFVKLGFCLRLLCEIKSIFGNTTKTLRGNNLPFFQKYIFIRKLLILTHVDKCKAMETSDWKSEEEFVKLNVGGHLFETTRETLTKYQGTYFSAQLNGKYKADHAKKHIFIDRSPIYFAAILDFLRTAKVNISGDISEESLREEARFYGLEDVMFNDEDEEETVTEIVETAVFDLRKSCEVDLNIGEYSSAKNEMLSGSVLWICDGTCTMTIEVRGKQPHGGRMRDLVFSPHQLMQGNTKQFLLFERTESMKIHIMDIFSDPECSGNHNLIVTRSREVDEGCIRTKKRKRESD